MAILERSAASIQFDAQMARLRAKIEALPTHRRSALRLLADEAERHHRVMEGECLHVHTLVDDIRLRDASMKFNLWAMKENLRRMFH